VTLRAAGSGPGTFDWPCPEACPVEFRMGPGGVWERTAGADCGSGLRKRAAASAAQMPIDMLLQLSKYFQRARARGKCHRGRGGRPGPRVQLSLFKLCDTFHYGYDYDLFVFNIIILLDVNLLPLRLCSIPPHPSCPHTPTHTHTSVIVNEDLTQLFLDVVTLFLDAVRGLWRVVLIPIGRVHWGGTRP